MVTVQDMFLRNLLPQYGVSSIAEFRRRLDLTKQYAWLLWHGKIALSADMMRRLHGELGIPLEPLMQVERAEPAKRRGRPPQRLPLAYRRARRDAADETGLPLATFPEACPWPVAQVLDEDFWPEADEATP